MEIQRFCQAGTHGYQRKTADGVQEEVARKVVWRGRCQEDRKVRCEARAANKWIVRSDLTSALSGIRQRHLPSAIKKTADLKRTMLDAKKAKEENRRRHTREGESKPKAERQSKRPFVV